MSKKKVEPPRIKIEVEVDCDKDRLYGNVDGERRKEYERLSRDFGRGY